MVATVAAGLLAAATSACGRNDPVVELADDGDVACTRETVSGCDARAVELTGPATLAEVADVAADAGGTVVALWREVEVCVPDVSTSGPTGTGPQGQGRRGSAFAYVDADVLVADQKKDPPVTDYGWGDALQQRFLDEWTAAQAKDARFVGAAVYVPAGAQPDPDRVRSVKPIPSFRTDRSKQLYLVGHDTALRDVMPAPRLADCGAGQGGDGQRTTRCTLDVADGCETRVVELAAPLGLDDLRDLAADADGAVLALWRVEEVCVPDEAGASPPGARTRGSALAYADADRKTPRLPGSPPTTDGGRSLARERRYAEEWRLAQEPGVTFSAGFLHVPTGAAVDAGRSTGERRADTRRTDAGVLFLREDEAALRPILPKAAAAACG